MINEINYVFNNTLDTSLGYDIPGIDIELLPEKLPEEAILEIELMQLSGEYVREIVRALEEVKEGKREKVIFGFETTMIWCYQKGKSYYGEKYSKSEVTITYNYADNYIITELKIDQILKMMKDWRDYIEAWEKKTGKKYNGI